MKQISKFFALAIVMIAFSASALGQVVSATALATATIVTPIGIANAGNMNFGNLAVGAVGTAVITPAGVRSVTGGVTMPATPGTVSAAHFNVTGTANFTYTITLPSTPTTVTSGANTMTVTTFTSNPNGTGTLSGLGAQTIDVGATLNVGAAQAAGTYVSGTQFVVQVNYN